MTNSLAVVMPKDFPHGAKIATHTHRRHQFLWAEAGLMHVRIAGRVWIVPPRFALWVPAECEHALRMVGAVHMRTLYIEPSTTSNPMSFRCRLVLVSPFMKQLILEAAKQPLEFQPGDRTDHLIALILDELVTLKEQPLCLPMPKDQRLLRLCNALLANPANSLGLEAWGYKVGASSRTLARLFARETGMRFLDWRNQARLTYAMLLLAEKAPVSRVAHRLGYASPSAFSAMMRRTLGIVPRDLSSET